MMHLRMKVYPCVNAGTAQFEDYECECCDSEEGCESSAVDCEETQRNSGCVFRNKMLENMTAVKSEEFLYNSCSYCVANWNPVHDLVNRVVRVRRSTNVSMPQGATRDLEERWLSDRTPWSIGRVSYYDGSDYMRGDGGLDNHAGMIVEWLRSMSNSVSDMVEAQHTEEPGTPEDWIREDRWRTMITWNYGILWMEMAAQNGGYVVLGR